MQLCVCASFTGRQRYSCVYSFHNGLLCAMRRIWPFLMTLFACSGGVNHADKQIFRYNEAEGITSLDPAFARNFEHIWACDQLFDGLVEMAPDLRVRPAVAKRWDIEDSGRTYVFHLNNAVRFHDSEVFDNGVGRRVLSSDVMYSFERIRNEETASPGSWIFDQVDSFETQGDETFIVNLKQPFPAFLGILSMVYASIVPQEAIEHYQGEWRSNPVGSGPFRFGHWLEGVKLSLLKNEHYYQAGEAGEQLPFLDAVVISFVKDKNAAFLNLQKGDLDMLSGLEGSYKNELLDALGNVTPEYHDKIEMIRLPWLKTDYLGFLLDSTAMVMDGKPWLDKRVRSAIAHALDRKKLVDFIYNGIGRPADGGFIPAGLPSFDPQRVKGPGYDPDKARELLVEAGFPNGEGLPPLVLSTTASHLELCEFVQHELGRIGVEVKVDVVPLSSHKQGVSHGEMEFFRKNWLADYPDEENFLLLFYSKNRAPAGPNYMRFSNNVFDSMYEQSLSESDPFVRRDLYQQMDSILVAETAVIQLYYPEVVRFVRKGVNGLGGDAMNMLDLRRVRVDDIR